MNVNIIIIFFSSSLFLVSIILLFYFQYAKIFAYLQQKTKHLMKTVIKEKINKDLIAHAQNWKCASCNGIMLTQFKITTDNYQHFAICINCSSTYKCVDNQCLV